MSARPRLLIIKTSSLGDVVHALPAVSDIIAAKPGWQIDWVCEEAFADIPELHPGVARVIPCAIRKWRRSWWSAQSRHEIARFKETLRQSTYDVVLDLQGLLKSAWIARQASGERHGYTWSSAREPLATWPMMCATRLPGINMPLRATANWPVPRWAFNRTARRAMVWWSPQPDIRWRFRTWLRCMPPAAPTSSGRRRTGANCSRALSGRGLRIVLPWGTPLERERSERLATGIDGAVVPARMAPRELAGLFAAAQVVVGVDTGLLHLAVAAGAPALALFGPTNPALTGVQGERAPALNLGGNGVVPDVDQVLDAANKLLAAGAERPAAQAALP